MLPTLLLLACADPRPVAPPPVEATQPVAPAPSPRRAPRVDARARIVAVGDIMMHGMVKKTASDHASETNHEGFDVLWEQVAPHLRDADLAFGNLETPIAPDHHRGVRQMVFNAPTAVLDSLHHAGFDIVSFANNHVYDQGRGGLQETVERLTEHPLRMVGAGLTCAEAWAPELVEVNGIQVAFIGSTDLYNDDLNTTDDAPCSATFSVDRALSEALAARKAGAELVVLSVHWGVEYATAPLAEHTEAAHALIDGGVDVVLGHHPHVLQPVEVRVAPDGRRGLIAYSLGNFVSNQSAWWVDGLHSADAGNPRDGLLLSFEVVRKDYGRGSDGEPLMRTELAALSAVPLWTRNNTHHRRGDDKVHIAVEPTLDRWQSLCTAEESTDDDDARVALRREIDTLASRRDQVEGIVGPGIVPPPLPCPH
jgi:poly-gamma-glutamate synthesis protein (capsule biosynthesis protein)